MRQRNKWVRKRTRPLSGWELHEEIYSSKLDGQKGHIFVRQLSNKGISFVQTKYSFPNPLCLKASVYNLLKALGAPNNSISHCGISNILGTSAEQNMPLTGI